MGWMSEKVRCYVASPLGFSEPGRFYYAQVLLPRIEDVAVAVDPWSLVGQDQVAAATRDGREAELVREIGQRNREALSECQVLVAILDGQELDAGTCAEVGYASALGLRCLGLRTDFRETGEPGATVNLQVEAFIALSGGRIVGSLDDLLSELRQGPPE
jgi:nucleoside 2-deoxyribosyltransferase